MLVSIVIGELLYLGRRAPNASPALLVGARVVMAVMPHGPMHLRD